MTDTGARRIALAAGLALLLSALFAACGDGDAGLTRAEVEEIVRAETAGALTEADVEDAVRMAIAETAQPEPGLSRSEVEEIVRAEVADIPPKSAPAEYTRFFVENAIARYETRGLDATLAHYNREESVDGQWYVFIATPEGEVLGHYNAERFAPHLQEMLDDGSFQATAEGVWVNHEDVNPVTGEMEDKHFWLVERDGPRVRLRLAPRRVGG